MDHVPTIAESFSRFAKGALPGAPEEVLDFVRDAYYAASSDMLRAVRTISRTSETPAAGIASLERFAAELGAYGLQQVARLLAESGQDGKAGMMVVSIRTVADPDAGRHE